MKIQSIMDNQVPGATVSITKDPNPTFNAANESAITRTMSPVLNRAWKNNDCASGAAAGMIGELTAGYLDRNTNLSNPQIIEASKLTGALTAAMVSGPDDGDSVFAGSQIARNAAENNATYINKNGKILKVDVTDGDKGVYVDNQDGGTSKDVKVGETEYIDEFIIPESGNVPTKAQIHIGITMDENIKTLSNEGGGKVGGWNAKLEIAELAFDSRPGGKFDIKDQKAKYGGSFDGYLLNGKYATMRSAGNYLAGVNAAKAGVSWQDNIWAAGVLHKPIMLNRSGPYYGELPYAGRRIEAGFNSVPN